MAGTGRKVFVMVGVLASTVVVSGVAGAEPERDMSIVRESRVVSVEVQQEGGSSREQYSIENRGLEEESRGEEVTSPDPGGGGEDSGEPGAGGTPESGDERVSGEEQDESGQEPEATEAESGGEPARSGDVAGDEGGEPEPADSRSVSDPESGTPVVLEGTSRDGPAEQSSQEERGGEKADRDVERPAVSRESGDETGGEVAARDRTVQSPEIRSRVREFRVAERAGELPPAATGFSPENRRQELRIAREEIFAEPVDEESLRRYKELYEEAAEEYGFGEDWYILAAVGKVESAHGQNMGPSSAGALGPMQFMPSTWDSYGIDANGDGEANIMDPEDAIPSAARYLEAGGAPDDWYKALYTYNHAGWYVEKVLKVAEGYRLAAGDEEVGPYYLEDR